VDVCLESKAELVERPDDERWRVAISHQIHGRFPMPSARHPVPLTTTRLVLQHVVQRISSVNPSSRSVNQPQ
jgi:hypothetical protein